VIDLDRAVGIGFGLSAVGWALRGWLLGQAATVPGATIASLNLVVGLLFLLRRPPLRSASVRDALLCLGSVFASGVVLRLAPPLGEWPLAAAWTFAVAGAAAIASLATLGASFAVLPSVRGVVERGPYRVLRHPAYAAEAIMVGAASFAAPRAASVAALAGALALVVVRIRIEERLLGAEPSYRAYESRVRWRLVPGVW
jgi:protein-S-isoprenylcysteine O-methyltransferase Ste14